MKRKKIIIDICMVICLAVFAFSVYQIFSFQSELRELEQEQKEVEEILNTPIETEEEQEVNERFTPESFDRLHDMNKDYVCYLEFDSRLISLPVVQTDDNDYYLSHSFKKKSSSQGAVFVDCRNLFTDTNITMYGHYVYADNTKMFTPLTKLKKESNYEKHKILKLHFREETRVYEVAYVYEFDYTKTNYDYTVRNFGSKKALESFLKYPEDYQYYDTGVNIEYGDSFITLQTCVRNQDTKRLIVVAKEKK